MGQMLWIWIRRAGESVILYAIVRGIFAALAERGIHPDLWVAQLIDAAADTASQSTEAMRWILPGLVALVLVPLVDWAIARSPWNRGGTLPLTSSKSKTGAVPEFLSGEWILNFNRTKPHGTKKIGFASGGSVIGGGDNEFRWELHDDILLIYQRSKLLQNRFRYDKKTGSFISTNDPDVRGAADQIIYRPSLSDDPDWPLSDALLWLWEGIRKLPQFASYVERYEAEPKTMMKKVAQMMFNHAHPTPSLYGTYPPRKEKDLVPPEHIDGYEFSDDASELFDKYWGEDRRYINLYVKRSEVEKRLQEMSK